MAVTCMVKILCVNQYASRARTRTRKCAREYTACTHTREDYLEYSCALDGHLRVAREQVLCYV